MQYFTSFCGFLDKDPDNIIKQREKDQLNPDKKIHRRFESELNAYIALKNKEGYKVATLQVMWASIRSFFEIH